MNSYSPSPLRILVAEDDADDRLLMTDAFEESRLSNPVDFVEDGIEAMNYLRREGTYGSLRGEPLPGLILLDLNMPRMDGRATLKEIKSSPDFQRIPVVVLTTSNSEEDIQSTYNLGGSSFITKPVSFPDFVKTIQVMTQYWIEIVALPPADD